VYKNKLSRINTGRANPMILSSVKINYYDSLMAITELASISVSGGTQLIIKPFDHAITKDIVYSINSASLGVDAKDEGDKARINFPVMTREKRIILIKNMATSTEESRIEIRQARQTLSKVIKKNEISEDQERNFLKEMQELTNKYVEKIKDIKEEKEKELMEI
jgi:ribosome recycling factor